MNAFTKIALVTGAGSGIGRASALALIRDGFHVVLAGRREQPLRETASMAKERSGNALTAAADVTSPESVEQLFAVVEKTYGRLDVLFNNAGVNLGPVATDALSLEDWDRLMRVNLTGSFLCAQQALRLMLNQTPKGGRIINNGSLAAHMPRVKAAAYAASKHAITGLTRSICLDYRNDAISCSQIDIGNADAGLAGTMRDEGRLQPDGNRRYEATLDVAIVADAVAYLAKLPLETSVPFMTIMPNAMPYMGRG